jgi:ribose/xylose/arabinose/galactoside ABC-type transport system permease subunit
MTTPPHAATPDTARADAPAPRQPAPRGWRAALRAVLDEHFVLALVLAYFLAVWPFLPQLASGENLRNLLSSMLPLLLVTLGQMVVLVTGGIDLSVPSVIAMASVCGAWVMNETTGLLAGSALATPAAVAAMVAVGAGVGLFNGFSVAALGMPPFIVTLATMMGLGGVAVWSTRSRNIPNLPDSFVDLAWRTVGGIPVAAAGVAAVALLIHFMLGRLLVGRWLYAVGLNARAARVSGVPVRTVTAFSYVLSAACAAAGSVLYTARLQTGSPTLVGREFLLDVIGAAVIGGASLFGGKGKVLWTTFGVRLFSLISNTLNLLGLEHFTVISVKGAVILLAALLDRGRARLLAAV